MASTEVTLEPGEAAALGLGNRTSTNTHQEAAAAFRLDWSQVFSVPGECGPGGKHFVKQYADNYTRQWNLATPQPSANYRLL